MSSMCRSHLPASSQFMMEERKIENGPLSSFEPRQYNHRAIRKDPDGGGHCWGVANVALHLHCKRLNRGWSGSSSHSRRLSAQSSNDTES